MHIEAYYHLRILCFYNSDAIRRCHTCRMYVLYLRSKNTSNSFVIGRSFKIPFIIRPWDHQPVHKKGSVWRSFFPVSFWDLSFRASQYSGWILVTESLPSALFFGSKILQLTQITNYLLPCSAQKLNCVCMRKEARGVKPRNETQEQIGCRRQGSLITFGYLHLSPAHKPSRRRERVCTLSLMLLCQLGQSCCSCCKGISSPASYHTSSQMTARQKGCNQSVSHTLPVTGNH